jgi:hypothetical protein
VETPNLHGFIALIWLMPAVELACVAAAHDRSYLDCWFHSRRGEMPAIVSPAKLSRPLAAVAVLAGLMMAATLTLWAYYGTAVFFEIVRAGWAACF